MKVEVSLGEAIDKYSILELKLKKINDTNKQNEIKKELDALSECITYKEREPFYYKLLFYINEQIWDMTNEIKGKTPDDSQFSIISNKIFEYNQKRFRIKNWFNCDSSLKEQKSYASTGCKIIIENEETIYNKIAEIHYIALNYDSISFETPFMETIKRLFNIPIYDTIESNNIIHLQSYEIPEPINREYFEFTPINYLAGGMFGDFIQSLSVVNETFYKTGKKGNIYIANKGDTFRYGLENTYNDTYDMLVKQKYINHYSIYANNNIDIDLTIWRNDFISVLDNNTPCNWSHIYNKKYGVNWGSHTWLETTINDKYTNTVFVNTTSYRWGSKINFKSLYEKYGSSIIFIGSDISQYNDFITKTKLNIPFYLCNTFTEMCILINSCKLFVGGLSGPLTIAHACNKDRIIALQDNSPYDTKVNSEFNNIWNNVYYTV
jgi:hypothetical protein